MAGREMGDADGVFAQFYEHLRLPDYFGWNWDALRDCLQDLHWLPAASVLLAIDDAECILPDMREERRILFRILSDSIKYWSGKADIPGQGKRSLRAMLLCEADSVASLQRQFPDTADSP
ncbi:hypothetical protein DN402_13085 [Streptomyces sp. SW4]|nr:hypothetical protein DN402_13085 [Streptomyces sp. SW4]